MPSIELDKAGRPLCSLLLVGDACYDTSKRGDGGIFGIRWLNTTKADHSPGGKVGHQAGFKMGE